MSVESLRAVDSVAGPAPPPDLNGDAAPVDVTLDIEQSCGGAASPYPDAATAELAVLVRWWVRFDKMQRGMQTANQPKPMIEAAQKIERSYRRQVEKALKRHPLWSWLEDKPGLRGPFVAWIIARIRDPRRFPGQRCAAGHYLPAVHDVGSPCPIEPLAGGEDANGRCGEPILPVRRGSGVRSVWHYFGLHVENGRRAHKMKGKKTSWVTEAGGILLGPKGIADQIVAHGAEPYRGIYEQQKERLQVARGADTRPEIDHSSGVTDLEWVEADNAREIDGRRGLRPFQVHRIARTIAVKAFVGDLLIEWKGLMSSSVVVPQDEIAVADGEEAA